MQTPNIAERIQTAYQQPKLKNCYDGQIKEALIEIYTLIGIKEGNLPANKATIYDYIKTEIGEFTIAELPLAFRLYSQSALDYQPGQYNSVQSFSTIFISNIMQSFSRYRLKYLPKQNEYKERQYTAAEIKKIMVDGCKNCFRRFRDKDILLDYGNPTYNYLANLGIIKKTYHHFMTKARQSVKEGFINSKRKDWMQGQSMALHMGKLEQLNSDDNK